jgi:hypothetical protein
VPTVDACIWLSDGSSVETQTYRKGLAHRPMESTLRFRELNFPPRCSKSIPSREIPKKTQQGAIK